MDSVSNKAKEKIDLVNEDKDLSSTVDDLNTEQRVSRALDAQIATRIMQWRSVGPDCYTPIGREWCGDDPSGVGGFNRTGRKIIPRYSADVAAAMQVVERLYAAEWAVEIHRSIVIDDDWSVQLSRIGRNGSVESVAQNKNKI